MSADINLNINLYRVNASKKTWVYVSVFRMDIKVLGICV